MSIVLDKINQIKSESDAADNDSHLDDLQLPEQPYLDEIEVDGRNGIFSGQLSC